MIEIILFSRRSVLRITNRTCVWSQLVQIGRGSRDPKRPIRPEPSRDTSKLCQTDAVQSQPSNES